MQNWLIYSLVGAFAGVFAGMGMGGGTFLIPLLMLFSAFSQVQAQSVNLVAFIPMAILALIIHAKNHLINFKVCFVVIALASVGTLLGVLLLKIINVEVLKKMYATFLLIIGFILLLDAIKNKNNVKQ